MFSQIVGQKDQVEELKRIAETWRDPRGYSSQFGVEIPHVVLLVGAAGTGKSTMVKALAKQADLSMRYLDDAHTPSDFQEWIELLVSYAMSVDPFNTMGSIALLEDLDQKMAAAESQGERSPSEIFALEMDVPKRQGLVLVTARSETPLKSLIEKGIFDRIVRLDLPTVRENEIIFERFFSDRSVKRIDPVVIASILHGKTVTDLEKVWALASEIAFARKDAFVSMKDLVDAALRYAFDAREISQKDKHRLDYSAYHEAGHALAEEILRPGSVAVASIRTYHSSIAGVTCETYPDERWENDLDQRINVRAMLAGKAAVQVKYKATDVGSTFDIKMAKRMERRRVEKYEEKTFHDLHRRSENTYGIASLDDEYDHRVREILCKEYGEVENFFYSAGVKDCLDALARALMEKETLLGEEVRDVIAKFEFDEEAVMRFKVY